MSLFTETGVTCASRITELPNWNFDHADFTEEGFTRRHSCIFENS